MSHSGPSNGRAPTSRGHQGCWPCRFRKKRCFRSDPNNPVCDDCQRFWIDCIGYDLERPRRPNLSKDVRALIKNWIRLKVDATSGTPRLSIAHLWNPSQAPHPAMQGFVQQHLSQPGQTGRGALPPHRSVDYSHVHSPIPHHPSTNGFVNSQYPAADMRLHDDPYVRTSNPQSNGFYDGQQMRGTTFHRPDGQPSAHITPVVSSRPQWNGPSHGYGVPVPSQHPQSAQAQAQMQQQLMQHQAQMAGQDAQYHQSHYYTSQSPTNTRHRTSDDSSGESSDEEEEFDTPPGSWAPPPTYYQHAQGQAQQCYPTYVSPQNMVTGQYY